MSFDVVPNGIPLNATNWYYVKRYLPQQSAGVMKCENAAIEIRRVLPKMRPIFGFDFTE
ncbi:MAG: hypothetical protein P1V21_18505 [Rhizobiaceae bacterium]|nr:hypothetical protein [Rhizobiaceae bacterium]